MLTSFPVQQINEDNVNAFEISMCIQAQLGLEIRKQSQHSAVVANECT